MRRLAFAGLLTLFAVAAGRAVDQPACGKVKVVEELVIGKFHTCARLEDGGLACWGQNTNGQLGDGTRTHRESPVLVPNLCDVTHVAAGGEDTCVTTRTGPVQCWGLMFGGPTPKPVEGTAGLVAIAKAQVEGCGIRADGTVVCWWPGVGKMVVREIPVRDVRQITLSKGNVGRAFAVRKDDSVWTWTELGEPERVAVDGVRDLSCGGDCCALLRSGAVSCWSPTAPTPVRIPDMGKVLHVAAGLLHRCVLFEDHTVKCWGSNNIGRLGDGTEIDRPEPTLLPDLRDVQQIVPGNFVSCAVLRDGKVKCWGSPSRNGGLIGDGTADPHFSPVDVPL